MLEDTLNMSDQTVGKCQNKRYIPLEHHLRPFIYSMKACGTYFTPWHRDSDSRNGSYSCWMTSFWVGRVYSGLVLLILWFNFIRFAAVIFPSDAGLPLRVILCTWCAQCALNATVMFVICQKKDLLDCFYKSWDLLFTDRTTQGIGCGFCLPKKFIWVCLFCTWISIITNNATMYCFLFGNFPTSDFISSQVMRPLGEWFRYVYAVMHIFETFAWMFPLMFLCVVCRVIRAQFLSFSSVLEKQIKNADGCIPEPLPDLRLRYTQLCQVLEVFNKSFKWMIGISFLIEVFLACFVSYQIIQRQTDALSLATYLFWFGVTFMYIVILALSTADVHEAAHSSLDSIFRVGTKNATNEQLGQLYLFVSKLTGTSVGLTAINFFVITKELLLTIGGLYVTYFFLLLQFKIT